MVAVIFDAVHIELYACTPGIFMWQVRGQHTFSVVRCIVHMSMLGDGGAHGALAVSNATVWQGQQWTGCKR